jgi:hypothetical protein
MVFRMMMLVVIHGLLMQTRESRLKLISYGTVSSSVKYIWEGQTSSGASTSSRNPPAFIHFTHCVATSALWSDQSVKKLRLDETQKKTPH